MATIARGLADWFHALRFEAIPENTVHETKRRVIDTLGCALGAFGSPPATICRTAALACPDHDGALLWGQDARVRPEMAAFANGTMVRYLDCNDTYLGLEPAHPSDNIPAAVAVAEKTGASGRELIAAIVGAYEIQCRLADAASLRARGWDHVYYGVLSSALAAGKLLRLTPERLEHALGIAGVCNIPTRQTRTGQISMWKACAFSNAARNGIFAAELADRGLTGPADIFEGPRGIFSQLTGPFQLDPALWDGFMIDRTSIKFWPAEYHAQSAIEGALELRKEILARRVSRENLADAVDSVAIGSFEAAVSIIGSEPEKWRPTSRETADHSLPFCVASALLDGDVTVHSFREERLRDPKILALLDRTRVFEKAEFNRRYPGAIPNEIEITLRGGPTLRREVDCPRGHARNPMTDDEVVAKFLSLADATLAPGAAERVIESVFGLEALSDAGGLAGLLANAVQVR